MKSFTSDKTLDQIEGSMEQMNIRNKKLIYNFKNDKLPMDNVKRSRKIVSFGGGGEEY